MALFDVAQLQMGDTELLRQFLRSTLERIGNIGAVCGDTSVDGERQADERMAENETPDVRKRKHPLDLAADLGVQEMCFMTEHVAKNPLPACAMKERGLCAAGDERIPARRLPGIVLR